MTISHFTAKDSALLLIDYQVGTIAWVGSIDQDVLKVRAIALAKAAKALEIPVVLTSSLEDQAQGPILPEIAELFPEEFANRIQRVGVVNAMDDPDFAAAVKGTGRSDILLAGVTNDVCAVFPTLTLLEQGHRVAVVADASGSIGAESDATAIERMRQAGAEITSANMLLAELAGNWTTAAGAAVLPSIGDLLPG